MAARSEYLLRHIRRLVSRVPPDPDTDAALLERFARERDEAAFASLVARHGPTVLGVCRRVLGDAHAAEDVFQATFLVLARKAAKLRRPDRLAAWLHGVAQRLALNCRRAEARRHSREARVPRATPVTPQPDPLDALSARELLTLLDEEVQRLPEAYRLPLVLCCLEGRTQEEAAQILGCTPGSVKGRLERGRARLHVRLMKRGLTLSSALAAAEVARGAMAGVPPLLAGATVRGAVAFAGGQGATPAGLSGKVVTLAEEALRGMVMSKVKSTMVLLLASALVAAGAGVLAQQVLTPKPPQAKQGAAPLPVARTAGEPKARRTGQPRSDRYGDILPTGAVVRLGTVRFRHGGPVFSIALSPDGKVLASGSGGRDNTARLWEAATGKELRRLPRYEGQVYSVALSPDGKLLATAGDRELGSEFALIHLWEVETGREIRRLRHPEVAVYTVTFSPDGKTLAAGGWDNTIRLWEVATGKQVGRLRGHTQIVWSFAFSPRPERGRHTGSLLASASADNTVRLWDPSTGRELRKLPAPAGAGSAQSLPSVALFSDGRQVAGGFGDGAVCVWEAATGKQLFRAGGKKGLQRVAFSPDGRLLASGCAGVIWELATGKERVRLEGLEGWVPALAFAPDGKTLAATGRGGVRIGLWDVATGKEIPSPSGHTDIVWSVAYSPNGKRLVTGSLDGTVRL